LPSKPFTLSKSNQFKTLRGKSTNLESLQKVLENPGVEPILLMAR
jgi:hypothetical protein